MKRELKQVDQVARITGYYDHKANPDEKGTETP